MKKTITKKEIMDVGKMYDYRSKCDPIRYKMIELADYITTKRDQTLFTEVQEVFKNEFDKLHNIAIQLDGYVYKWANDEPKTQHDKEILWNELK